MGEKPVLQRFSPDRRGKPGRFTSIRRMEDAYTASDTHRRAASLVAHSKTCPHSHRISIPDFHAPVGRNPVDSFMSNHLRRGLPLATPSHLLHKVRRNILKQGHFQYLVVYC